MMTPRTVSQSSLAALLDAVHDRWFDLADVRIDDRTEAVTLHLGDSKHGPFHRELTVKPVSALDVQDEAHIGLYDLDSVRVNQVKKEIVVTSGFPLKLTMCVGDEWELVCRDRDTDTVSA